MSESGPEKENRIPQWYGRTTIDRNELPLDIQERIDAVEAKSGFVPEVFTSLARMPAEFRAFFAYHDALMESKDGLSKAEREMIVVATSAANSCLYCVVAHGAILRIRAKNPRISEQVALDFEKAEITERQKAILRFAHKVALHPADIAPADFSPLFSAGLNDDEIWNIGAIAAFFAMSNRLAGLGNILPNEEFYSMGR